MRSLAFAILLIVNPALGKAQESSIVRSGEHATFTRLVIDISPTTDWSAAMVNRTVSIAVPEIGRLNTTDVFQRIPRTRLLDAESTSGMLTLRLGCSCPVQVFKLGSRALVVDIRDPQAQPAVDAADLSATPPAEALPPSEVSQEPEVAPEPSQVDLADVRDRLVEQLTRAADQGLLSLSEQVHQDLSSATEQTPQEELNIPAEDSISTLQEPRDPSVDIRTAFERPRENTDIAVQACAFPEPFVEGRAQDRYQHYIALQSELFGEFDRIDPATLDEIVRVALGLGFGAEAQIHIAQHDAHLADQAVLSDMARLIDGLPAGPALTEYQGCNGVAGLWGRLANPSREVLQRYSSQDLATLAALPPDHRILLGTLATENWIDHDLPSVAQAALDLAIRTGSPLSPELELSSARIDALRGNTAGAKQKFTALMDDAGIVGLHALVQLVELTLTLDEPIFPNVELSLAAAAFQLSGTSTGRNAVRALAQIRARDGNLSQSLTLLRQSAQREPEMSDIWRRVAADLIETTPPLAPDYARAVIENAVFIPDSVSGDAARLAAGRGLIELGLPTDAIELLRPASVRGNQVATDLIQATVRTQTANDAETPIPISEISDPQTPVPPIPPTLAEAEELIRSGDRLRITASELISGEGN